MWTQWRQDKEDEIVNNFSEGLLEAAWLTVSQYINYDDDDLCQEWCTDWIREYEYEMNSQLPDGVWFDTATCEQCCDDDQDPDEVCLDEYEYEILQTKVEKAVDERWHNKMKRLGMVLI